MKWLPRFTSTLRTFAAFLLLMMAVDSFFAADAPAVRGEGNFTVPGGTQTIQYRAYASKSQNGDNTAKFLLLLCNTNADPVRLVVCAMLDLKKKNPTKQPKFTIHKQGTNWVCESAGFETGLFYNYHWGCKRVEIPGRGTNAQSCVEVFKGEAVFGTDFKASELGTVYMDFLSDCPVIQCDAVKGHDTFLVPQDPSDRQHWRNVWVGGRYFPTVPIPTNLLFSYNPISVPSGNWVTMGYLREYPARVKASLIGAPVGTQVILSFNGNAHPSYTVGAAEPGKETVLSMEETFVIPPVMDARDEVNLVIPAGSLSEIQEGANVRFVGQVFAGIDAPFYEPGEIMYDWNVSWVHDSRAPQIQYQSVNPVGTRVQVQMDTTDATSLPMDPLLVYWTPEGVTNVASVPFSEPALEGDVVHFFGEIDGLPFGIPLNYSIQLMDVFGNLAQSLPQELYLYGSRLGIEASGDHAKLSWTTSESRTVLAARQDLGLGDLWRVVEGTPSLSDGTYAMPIGWRDTRAFFQLTTELAQPCAGGELLVRQAYAECQSDGFWHVVEDDYYACPPMGAVTKFRVADTKTDQPCGAGQAAPSVAGRHYKQLEGDTSCQSPVKVGEIRIIECVSASWEIAVYALYQCLDGGYRISIPAKSRTRTNVSCKDPVPSPFQ